MYPPFALFRLHLNFMNSSIDNALVMISTVLLVITKAILPTSRAYPQTQRILLSHTALHLALAAAKYSASTEETVTNCFINDHDIAFDRGENSSQLCFGIINASGLIIVNLTKLHGLLLQCINLLVLEDI